jgi:hypothetical protein
MCLLAGTARACSCRLPSATGSLVGTHLSAPTATAPRRERRRVAMSVSTASPPSSQPGAAAAAAAPLSSAELGFKARAR